MIYLLLIPALAISAFVMIAFGWIGLCGMSDCLGSGHAGWDQKLLGALFIFLALQPLLATLFLLYRHIRRKSIGTIARSLIWLLIALLVILGAISVLDDPGDAIWAGLPLLGLALLLGSAMWFYPINGNDEKVHGLNG